MNIVCVDDEKIILDALVSKCNEIDFVDKVFSFKNGISALEFIKTNNTDIFDVAILDIDMPDITGLELAKNLKQVNPNIEVIFATGFSQFAVDAFKIRATGYLLKPISKEDLIEELSVVKNKRKSESNKLVNENNGIYGRTFGNFDLLVNGKPIEFSWKKSKEVLAYLIDRNGAIVTRKELAGILFDDAEYTRSNQTYISKIINRLVKNLTQVGAESIFIKGNDSYSVDTTKMNCDSWDFLKGTNKEMYHGEYMLQYSWAELSISKFEN